MLGATRGSPRSARETVDWLIFSLRAMSLLVTAMCESIADGCVAVDKRLDAVYAYVVTIRGRGMQALKTARDTQQRTEEQVAVTRVVDEILSAVAADGDEAVRRFSARLDRWEPQAAPPLRGRHRSESRSGARAGARRPSFLPGVRRFARAQQTLVDLEIETLPGVRLGHRHIPVRNVGAYVPGGRYPMVASARMSIVTAKVMRRGAGRSLYSAARRAHPGCDGCGDRLGGADEIYVLGGVQALAALAYGTGDHRPGRLPGRRATPTSSKRSADLFGRVGIDLVADPRRS